MPIIRGETVNSARRFLFILFFGGLFKSNLLCINAWRSQPLPSIVDIQFVSADVDVINTIASLFLLIAILVNRIVVVCIVVIHRVENARFSIQPLFALF